MEIYWMVDFPTGYFLPGTVGVFTFFWKTKHFFCAWDIKKGQIDGIVTEHSWICGLFMKTGHFLRNSTIEMDNQTQELMA